MASALDGSGRIHRLGEAEVEHLHAAVGADLHVRGLQIAMDDALLVRGFERVGDLPRDRQRLIAVAAGPRAMHGGEVCTLDQLHHQRRAPLSSMP